MTNKELAAQCLINASSILNECSSLTEGAARNTRKESISKLKILKNSNDVKKFLSGKLDKDEADEIYGVIKGELSQIKDKIVKMPPENFAEKLWTFMVRSGFSKRGFLWYFLAGFGLAPASSFISNVLPISAGAAVNQVLQILTTIGVYRGLSKVEIPGEDGEITKEYNWDKAHALSYFMKIEKKIDNAYNKYYSSINESVSYDYMENTIQDTIDMLLEAAVMCEDIDDAHVYLEKAGELQKAIEDIPEERAIEDDDYPTEVSGGDGYREDHLEDIKDLVDDDKKAIDLLTIDEDSLTID